MAVSYKITTPLVETDAIGVLGMIKRLEYKQIVSQKDIKGEIRKALKPVQKTVQQAAKSALRHDARRTSQGVKMSVYRFGKGGNVSLFNQRGTGRMAIYTKNRGGVSGIIRKRKVSERTKQIDSYVGRDRAFILRMLNQGTKPRVAFTRTKSKNGKIANRGSLVALNFFNASDGAMNQAANTLSRRIQALIVEAGYGK